MNKGKDGYTLIEVIIVLAIVLLVDCETNFKNWTKILIKAKYRKMIGIWIKISKKAHTKKA